VVKAVGAAYNVLRGGALTTAAVPNALESGTKSLALGGVGPWARAMWQIARHPISRELTAAIGARTVDRVKWMTRPGRTAEDVAKAISGILTYPMKAVNEFNELHAAQTGVELAKDVKAGKNAASNSFRLELLGFSPEQAERMSQGRGTEKEYKAIATRFPLVTQGAGRGSAGSPAERSRAANSGLYQALVPFDSYAQMTANRTARLYSRWLSAMRGGTVPQKAAATKVLAQYHVGHALAGAGAAFIYAYLNGGAAGVKERAAEARTRRWRSSATRCSTAWWAASPAGSSTPRSARAPPGWATSPPR
jgi:hypothetical protein